MRILAAALAAALSGTIVTSGNLLQKAIYGREYVKVKKERSKYFALGNLVFIALIIVSILFMFNSNNSKDILYAVLLLFALIIIYPSVCFLLALYVRKKSAAYREVKEAKEMGVYKKEFYQYDALSNQCSKCMKIHYLYHDDYKNGKKVHYCYKCVKDIYPEYFNKQINK